MTYNIGVLKYLLQADAIMSKAPSYPELEQQLLEVWEDYQRAYIDHTYSNAQG